MNMASLLASLVTVVGIAMADCDSLMDEATFGDFRTCSRSQVKESLGHQASCSPRAVVMRLPWPNSTMVGGGVQQMTPTHVAVMQCGGGCHRGSQGCIATATRTREVSVMVGKCGVSVGKCEKECATVTLEEHTKCGCGCQIDRGQCETDGLHRFKKELCQCECKDVEAKRSCLEQGRTWEEDSCTCGCPALKSCAPGSVYSATTCMCEPGLIDSGSKKVQDSEDMKDYINRMVGWEIVTIAILLLLVLCLLSVIFSLVARLQRMRRALKLKDFSVMEGEYHIYGELQARKVTEQMEEDKTYLEIASVSSSSGFGSDISKTDRESPATDSEKEHLYGKVNKAGRENVYGKVKKVDVRVKDGLEGRRTDNGVRQSEEKGVVETRAREAKEGEKNIPVREDRVLLPAAGRRQAKEATSAVRQTKSGIFRGPAVPELERVASNLDVIDEAFASNLDPIDEALRLLQESANHL